jgi:putative hydroxymethylpyrimidine transport system substrate-binding protein
MPRMTERPSLRILGGHSPRKRAAIVLAAILAAATVAVGCGSKSEGGPASAPESLTLALDWYVNPDHAGIYEAIDRGYFRDAGLAIHPEVPSDPSAPIREVAEGRADLAISYEPEVMLAHDEGLPVKAVAAIVPQPLTSLISLPKAEIKSPSDLRGKTVATAGIPYQAAFLREILARAGLSESDVHVVDVQQGLLPALISRRADAILGGFLNVEGVDLAQRGLHPRVVPVDRLGVPTYDELVLVANTDEVENDSRSIQLFIAALQRGTDAAAKNPAEASAVITRAGQGLAPKLTRAEIARTVPILAQQGTGHPFGYLDPRQWTRFAHFMADHGLINALPATSDILTNDLLPNQVP